MRMDCAPGDGGKVASHRTAGKPRQQPNHDNQPHARQCVHRALTKPTDELKEAHAELLAKRSRVREEPQQILQPEIPGDRNHQPENEPRETPQQGHDVLQTEQAQRLRFDLIRLGGGEFDQATFEPTSVATEQPDHAHEQRRS